MPHHFVCSSYADYGGHAQQNRTDCRFRLRTVVLRRCRQGHPGHFRRPSSRSARDQLRRRSRHRHAACPAHDSELHGVIGAELAVTVAITDLIAVLISYGVTVVEITSRT